jgi:hypothetical protein
MLSFSSLFLSTLLLLAARKGNCAPNVDVDRVTCSNLNAITIARAFEEMLDIAQVAYTRSVGADTATSPAVDRRVVINNFETYFGGTTVVDGRTYRLSQVIGKVFLDGCVRYHAANELTSCRNARRCQKSSRHSDSEYKVPLR